MAMRPRKMSPQPQPMLTLVRTLYLLKTCGEVVASWIGRERVVSVIEMQGTVQPDVVLGCLPLRLSPVGRRMTWLIKSAYIRRAKPKSDGSKL